jgi:hypothetical protein
MTDTREARPELLVATVHRDDCAFGTGFYRISLKGGDMRYCQSQEEVEYVHALLGRGQVVRVERDGYCLDGDRSGDARTPDVVDGEEWLNWPRERAMSEVGLTSERDYARVYKQVEAAVYRRNNRESQGGVHASIVIKRKGRRVVDATAEDDG